MSNLLAFRQDQEATDDIAEATDDIAEAVDDVAGAADDDAEFCQRMRARLAEKEPQQRRDHQRRIRNLRGMALVGLLLASVLAYLYYAWK